MTLLNSSTNTAINGSKKGSIETPPRAPSPVHKFGTLAVHAGSPHDPVTGAVIEPVCLFTLKVNVRHR